MTEEGSELAARLWGAPERAASSIVSYPEGRAALAAARRGGRLTVAGYRTALDDFEVKHAGLAVVGVDPPLARHAGELAEGLDLRGYDAVHLASALAFGADTTVVTWDKELAAAAARVGCAVAPAV